MSVPHAPKRLRLVFPGQLHEPEAFRELYEEFKRTHPNAFAEWYRIEDGRTWPEPDALKQTQKIIDDFMSTRVDWEDRAGLGEGFTAFRTLLAEEQTRA